MNLLDVIDDVMSIRFFAMILFDVQNPHMNEKQHPSYPLRMPKELRARLTEAASENNRSMNAEILERLQHSFTGPHPNEVRRGLSVHAYMAVHLETRIDTAQNRLNDLQVQLRIAESELSMLVHVVGDSDEDAPRIEHYKRIVESIQEQIAKQQDKIAALEQQLAIAQSTPDSQPLRLANLLDED